VGVCEGVGFWMCSSEGVSFLLLKGVAGCCSALQGFSVLL